MQVRHNTSLLEQAVEHIVRSAAVPRLQAEAEARAKMMRAQAHRRLATGCAIAAAAVGIGIGIYLSRERIAETLQTATAEEKKTEAQNLPAPAPLPQVTKGDSRLPEPGGAQNSDNEPDIVTTDFNRFTHRNTTLLGQKWEIVAGHYFDSEKDTSWKRAWCYTVREVNGVTLNIELATRSSPAAMPIGPIATEKTLNEAQLTDIDALSLAIKCSWLDRRDFVDGDFSPPPGRSRPSLDTASYYRMVGRTLVFEGPIREDFASKLVGLNFGELQINSPGGSLVQAMEAGRLVRQRGVKVVANAQCLSACVLVLAGGLVREAKADARIGVHRFSPSTSIDGGVATEVAQQMSSTIIQYLSQMGVDAELFHRMAAVPSNEMVFLPHEQLQRWNLLGSKRDIAERQIDVPMSGTAPPPKKTDNAKADELLRYLGRDALGGDYRKMEKASLADCENSCKQDNKCRAVTYDRWNKLCFLKTEVGLLRREPRSLVAVKKSVRVKMDAKNVTFLQRKGRAFPDKPFRVISVRTFDQCLFICSKDNDCEAVNFMTANSSCALLKNVSPYKENLQSDLGMKLQAP